jgi:glyoxylase-like metal-dependent hydrolase (beta-lactamase superfamily II)
LTLIDTSSGGVADRILAAIDEIGRKPKDLRTIVTSHYHYDHTGNANELRERTGAAVLAHADDVPYIDGQQPWGTGRPSGGIMAFVESRLAPPPPFALTVDRTVRDGDRLDGGLRVIHAPGHTPGHIALLDEALGVLFAADAFMNVLGFRLPVAASTHDMDLAKRSIASLSRFDFDHALPGHGAPILSHAAEKLRLWVRRWLDEDSAA